MAGNEATLGKTLGYGDWQPPDHSVIQQPLTTTIYQHYTPIIPAIYHDHSPMESAIYLNICYSLYYQQYSQLNLPWTQQSVSSYAHYTPIHQQHIPITLSWNQQLSHHMPIISLIHQQSIPTYVPISLSHQPYSPIILPWTQQSVSPYVYYIPNTSAIYPAYSLMESAINLIKCHYILYISAI